MNLNRGAIDQLCSNLKTELDVLKYWEAIKAFETSIENNKDCPEFIFYDGPPFATGLPHYGHRKSVV